MFLNETNDKATEASKKMEKNKGNTYIRQFHYGQFMAFSTMHTMFQVQLSHLTKEELNKE